MVQTIPEVEVAAKGTKAEVDKLKKNKNRGSFIPTERNRQLFTLHTTK